MRTILDIDDKLLTASKELAKREGRTRGAVATELIRRGLRSPADEPMAEVLTRNGFRPFSSMGDGAVVTNEDVSRLRNELDI